MRLKSPPLSRSHVPERPRWLALLLATRHVTCSHLGSIGSPTNSEYIPTQKSFLNLWLKGNEKQQLFLPLVELAGRTDCDQMRPGTTMAPVFADDCQRSPEETKTWDASGSLLRLWNFNVFFMFFRGRFSTQRR